VKLQSPPLPRHVAVLGAAGGLGQGILNVCRMAGVRFTAIVRSRPDRVSQVPAGSRVAVVASLADADALTGALFGVDAVITALGVTATSRDHSALLSSNMDAVEDAMLLAGVDRIVVVNTCCPRCRDSRQAGRCASSVRCPGRWVAVRVNSRR
jgi:putative NADH-flavin reductase